MCNHPSASFKHDSKQVIIHIKNGKQNINRVFQGIQGWPLAPWVSKQKKAFWWHAEMPNDQFYVKSK